MQEPSSHRRDRPQHLHQPHGHNDHHPQIATKRKDAAHSKHWRGEALEGKHTASYNLLRLRHSCSPTPSGNPMPSSAPAPSFPGAIRAFEWWRCQSAARQNRDRILSKVTLHGWPTPEQIVFPSRPHQAPSSRHLVDGAVQMQLCCAGYCAGEGQGERKGQHTR
jgi:hypothetical protein